MTLLVSPPPIVAGALVMPILSTPLHPRHHRALRDLRLGLVGHLALPDVVQDHPGARSLPHLTDLSHLALHLGSRRVLVRTLHSVLPRQSWASMIFLNPPLTI
jgi:hypothetical protein